MQQPAQILKEGKLDIANHSRQISFVSSTTLGNQSPQATAAKAQILKTANAEIVNYGSQSIFLRTLSL